MLFAINIQSRPPARNHSSKAIG